VNAPDDQATTAVAEAIHNAACNERADGAPYCTWVEDPARCDTSGQMPLADAAIAALRDHGWAPASETAERIARDIAAAGGPGAALDSYGTGMLRAARIARGQP
jgi:hypothetical protein